MKKILRNISGTTAIEYGIIAMLLSIVIIAALTVVGEQTNETYERVDSALSKANEAATNAPQ